MWIKPKTDWNAGDYFDLWVDYFRIKNNMLELKKLAQECCGRVNFIPLNDYGIADVGFADFYNNVERDIDAIADVGLRVVRLQPTKTWQDNKAAWTYLDLNRIEGAQLILFNLLNNINRGIIPFELGSEVIYATV